MWCFTSGGKVSGLHGLLSFGRGLKNATQLPPFASPTRGGGPRSPTGGVGWGGPKPKGAPTPDGDIGLHLFDEALESLAAAWLQIPMPRPECDQPANDYCLAAGAGGTGSGTMFLIAGIDRR